MLLGSLWRREIKNDKNVIGSWAGLNMVLRNGEMEKALHRVLSGQEVAILCRMIWKGEQGLKAAAN